AVNDVHISLDAVIDHLLFAISTEDDENRSFTGPSFTADLKKCFLAVIEDANWFERIVFSLDAIVEAQRLHRVVWKLRYCVLLLLLFLLRNLFLPLGTAEI